MAQLTLKDISDAMKDIDICMMTTKTTSGVLDSRPMSNNREVEYDGDSYFFTYGNNPVAKEIEKDAATNLAFIHRRLVGKDLYISVIGNGNIIRDRAAMEKHWVKDLEIWFEKGLDTPDLAMIHVKASRIKYWNGHEEGEVSL